MRIPPDEPSVKKDGNWSLWAKDRLHMYNCRLDGGIIAGIDCVYDENARLVSVMGTVMFPTELDRPVIVGRPVILYTGGADVPDEDIIRDAKKKALDMAREWMKRAAHDILLATRHLNRIRESEDGT